MTRHRPCTDHQQGEAPNPNSCNGQCASCERSDAILKALDVGDGAADDPLRKASHSKPDAAQHKTNDKC